MFEDYSYLGRMFMMSLVILGIMFGGQLFIYWLIDKFTVLSFPLVYRIGLAILVIVGYMWYMNIRS
jgi:hypothetical protein